MASKRAAAQTEDEIRAKQIAINRSRAELENADETRKRARKLFKKFDTNGDNTIDNVEFTALAKEMGLEITLNQAKEAIASIDKDGNETVDFDEFYTWYSSPLAEKTANAAMMNDLRDRLNRYKGSNAFMDAIGPMFGIFLPSDFSVKKFATASIKSFSSGTTGTMFESSRKKKVRAVFNEIDVDHSGAIDADEFRKLLAKMGQTDVDDKTLKEYIAKIDLDGNGTIEFEEFYFWWCSDPANSKDADAMNRLRVSMKTWTVANIWKDLVKGTALERKKGDSQNYDSAREEEEEIAAEHARHEAEAGKKKKKKGGEAAVETIEAASAKVDDKPKKKRKMKVTTASETNTRDSEAEKKPEAPDSPPSRKKKADASSSDSEDDKKEKLGKTTEAKPKSKVVLDENLDSSEEVEALTRILQGKVNKKVVDMRAEVLTLKDELRETHEQNKAMAAELAKLKAEKEEAAAKLRTSGENPLKQSQSGKESLKQSQKAEKESLKQSQKAAKTEEPKEEAKVEDKPAKKAKKAKDSKEDSDNKEEESKSEEKPATKAKKPKASKEEPKAEDKPAKAEDKADKPKKKAAKEAPKEEPKDEDKPADEAPKKSKSKENVDSAEAPKKKKKAK